MNLTALITTLVLGSSSAAMADSYTVSGSVNVSLGARPTPAPVYRPVVVADDCEHPYNNRPDPRPAYHPTRPVVYQPHVPVYRGPFYHPTNTTVGARASSYMGWIATSPTKLMHGGVVWRRTAPTTWFDLTEATRIDSNREFFTIGADNGVFKALKLQGLGGGHSHIKQVGIEFLDATGRARTQKVVLNRSLDAAHPITIDLHGGYRSINRIIVYGSTDRGSAYKILAM